MKKALLLLAAGLISFSASAQSAKDLEILNKRLVKSDATVADAKKANLAVTWLDRADVMYSVSNFYLGKLVAGYGIDQTKMMIGEPKSTQEVEIEGSTFQKLTYDNFIVYVDSNDEIASWEATKEVRPNALDEAYQALVKAHKLDANAFMSKGFLVADKINNQYKTNGMNLYNIGDIAGAAEDFSRSISISEMAGDVDSVMIYYTGIAYYEAQNFEKAYEYMKKDLDAGYDDEGNVSFYLALILGELGKPADAIPILEQAIAKNPESSRLMTQLVKICIDTKQEPDAIVELLAKARALDPKNVSLSLVEGSMWMDLGNNDKSLEAYKRVLEIEPANVTALYTIAVIYIDKGNEISKQAEALDVNDIKGYNAMIEKAVVEFDTATEYLEKAHTASPKDLDIVNQLRAIYYPQKDESPEKKARFEYFDQLYDKLQQEAAL